jgi:3-oxoacyl-ACP reductase-like protein
MSRSAGNFFQLGLISALMGMFTNLMSKIFGHAPAAPSTSAAPPNTALASAAPSAPTTPASAAAPAPVSEPAKTVDVTAILDDLAAKNPEKLDWRKSIVDLMKLVGIDSSLSARKQLATELHYSGDANDSAAMNVWLHKEVIIKLAENGGKVPQELLS